MLHAILDYGVCSHPTRTPPRRNTSYHVILIVVCDSAEGFGSTCQQAFLALSADGVLLDWRHMTAGLFSMRGARFLFEAKSLSTSVLDGIH